MAFLFTSLLIFLHVLSTHSACTSSDEPCRGASGECTAAVRLAIGGDLIGATKAVFYGKYCGALNKCVPKYNSGSKSRSGRSGKESIESVDVCMINGHHDSRKSSKGGSTRGSPKSPRSDEEGICPAEPCDDIDEICSVHDACLDQLIIDNPSLEGKRIPVPTRCPCDVAFVFSLAIQAGSTAPTGLCDADFYEEPISEHVPITPFQLLGHEAVFLAAGYCCDITIDQDVNGVPDCGEAANIDETTFAIAYGFCQNILGGLSSAGISVC